MGMPRSYDRNLGTLTLAARDGFRKAATALDADFCREYQQVYPDTIKWRGQDFNVIPQDGDPQQFRTPEADLGVGRRGQSFEQTLT